GLVRPPVVAGAPVVDELAHVVERHAVAPVDAGQLVRPGGQRQALLEGVEVALGDLGPEWLNVSFACCNGHGYAAPIVRRSQPAPPGAHYRSEALRFKRCRPTLNPRSRDARERPGATTPRSWSRPAPCSSPTPTHPSRRSPSKRA